MGDEIIAMVIRRSVAIIAIICATILAAKRREGWGWLIFVALMVGG